MLSTIKISEANYPLLLHPLPTFIIPLPKGRQLTDPFQQAATFPRLLLCMQINDGNDVYNSSLQQGGGAGGVKGGRQFIYFLYQVLLLLSFN